MSHPVDRLVRYTLGGGLPKLIFVVGLLAGALALTFTPREEEPQIVVPMVDVIVEAPGLSARQVERQVGEKTEGTGLGLAIAARSVEMLGGTIAAESEVGVGTTFTIRLPVGDGKH